MILQFGKADQEVPFRLLDASGTPCVSVDTRLIVVELFKPGRKVGFMQSGNKTAFRDLRGDGWFTYQVAPIDCDTYGINVFRATCDAPSGVKYTAVVPCDVVPEYPMVP